MNCENTQNQSHNWRQDERKRQRVLNFFFATHKKITTNYENIYTDSDSENNSEYGDFSEFIIEESSDHINHGK